MVAIEFAMWRSGRKGDPRQPSLAKSTSRWKLTFAGDVDNQYLVGSASPFCDLNAHVRQVGHPK
jgi:hypothetical protein